MNNKEIVHEIKDRKQRIEIVNTIIYELLANVNSRKKEKKRLQDEIANLASLPPKIMETEKIKR